jgi:hypothetical protein
MDPRAEPNGSPEDDGMEKIQRNGFAICETRARIFPAYTTQKSKENAVLLPMQGRTKSKPT